MMSEIQVPRRSSGWSRVAFGDVVQLSRKRSTDPETDGYERYVGLEHIDPGELRIRRWGDIADGVTFTSVFHPGQVLFGKRRAYQRKVAVADFSGVCSGDIYVLEPKVDALLPELLPFICQTEAFFEHAVGTSAGSLSPRTNWKSLSDFEFALPPIEEQRRMVRLLTAARSSVDAASALVEEAKRLRLSHIFDFESQVSKATTIKSLIANIEAGKSPASKGEEVSPDGFGVLKVSAVGDWEYDASEAKSISSDDYLPHLAVRDGDLLITRANANPEAVGRTCIVATTRDRLMLSDKTWRAQLTEEAHMVPFGVLAWTKSKSFRTHVLNHLNGTDAKNISQKRFLAGPAPMVDDKFQAFDSRTRELCHAVHQARQRLSDSQRCYRQVIEEVLCR